MPSTTPSGIRITIDRGGTFTDWLVPSTSYLDHPLKLLLYSWASIPGRRDDVVLKIQSVALDVYADAPTEGVRQILEIATRKPVPRGWPLDLSPVESIRMGTTVATKTCK
jgi:5-oxoprolinase (ATP-hydrolysing)